MKKEDALEKMWAELEANPVPEDISARKAKFASLMAAAPGAQSGLARRVLRPVVWAPLAAAACIAAVLLIRTPAQPALVAEPAQPAPGLLADGSPVEFVPKNGLNPEQTLISEAFVPKNTEIPEQTIRSVDPAASATAPQAAPAPHPAAELTPVAEPAPATEPTPDPFAETPSPRRRNQGFALGFFASGSTASDGASKVIVLNKIAADPESFISVFPDRCYSWLSSLRAYADTQSTTPETSKLKMHHDMPLNVGASISYGFTRRLALESGLTYSYLHSDITNGEDNYSRQLHYLGIPLALQFKVLESRVFSAYVSGGGSVAYCLGGRMSRIGGNSARINDHPTQLALTASAGAQYRIAGPFCIFGEVAFNRYFSDGTTLDTYYSSNPYAPSFKLGLRFDI
ncbi:MAG: porin family protein [Bacteroidales bacterium]|nr:porin family protein [Bacteroidales bacterium]